MAEGYNGAFTGPQIDEAISQVRGKNLPADGVKFSDGQSLQAKLDNKQIGGEAEYYVKTFTAAEWVQGSGERTITIPAAVHGMTGTVLQHQFASQRNGGYVTDSWAAKESYATLDTSGNIVLHCAATTSYDGRVVLTAVGGE